MTRTLRAIVVSASLAADSKSRDLARMAHGAAMNADGWTSSLIDLRDLDAPNFDDENIYDWTGFARLHSMVLSADAVVMASPVYNWGCSSELKKFIEYVGSTPPDGSLVGAYDKVITLLTAGGIAQSYMAFASTAISLMLDFKCIINPLQRPCAGGRLGNRCSRRTVEATHSQIDACHDGTGRSARGSFV